MTTIFQEAASAQRQIYSKCLICTHYVSDILWHFTPQLPGKCWPSSRSRRNVVEGNSNFGQFFKLNTNWTIHRRHGCPMALYIKQRRKINSKSKINSLHFIFLLLGHIKVIRQTVLSQTCKKHKMYHH